MHVTTPLPALTSANFCKICKNYSWIKNFPEIAISNLKHLVCSSICELKPALTSHSLSPGCLQLKEYRQERRAEYLVSFCSSRRDSKLWEEFQWTFFSFIYLFQWTTVRASEVLHSPLYQVSSGVCDGFCRVATEYSSSPTSPLADRDSPSAASKDCSSSSHHFSSLLTFLSDSLVSVERIMNHLITHQMWPVVLCCLTNEINVNWCEL